MYDWNDIIANIDTDISEYLEKRYKDYCKDRKEVYGVYSEHEFIRERHEIKRDKLTKLGIKLKEKLRFFRDKSRKELFKQHISELNLSEDYFKNKFNDFCKELEKTNDLLSLHRQKSSYILNIEKDKEEARLLKFKETIKDTRFIKIIDLRRHNYEKRVAKEEKRKVREERRKAKRKTKGETFERRQGLSNIKPLSFYESLFDSGDEYDNERIKKEQIYDAYFQRRGKPHGVWKKHKKWKSYEIRDRWFGDNAFSDKETDKYILSDSLDKNQIYLNRCKEQSDIVVVQKDSDLEYYLTLILSQIEIFQRYVSKEHLITRQIAWINKYVRHIMEGVCSTNPNYPYNIIKDHPSRKYNFSIYNDVYDIIKIKEDVSEFIRINEGMILTPLECLKVYLKKHDNRITIKEYAKFIDKSEYIASKILKKFEADGHLKSKREFKGLYVFYLKN